MTRRLQQTDRQIAKYCGLRAEILDPGRSALALKFQLQRTTDCDNLPSTGEVRDCSPNSLDCRVVDRKCRAPSSGAGQLIDFDDLAGRTISTRPFIALKYFNEPFNRVTCRFLCHLK
jgi:hypothetical protein